ncbi:ABC transporter permease [Falsochrobactrum shanghaiense]|uniref:ABC transporter permease n=1 Tax=Falsochrobactrum shanghaiense TaxID=2201899 RepID=A0A316J7Z2_9HYPH|nr:iron ABC transporter permease [Falsochrobactrum shanghaiense]PWL17278.1 ABC transporter permease [Falsochrobactrum shanghaiense]
MRMFRDIQGRDAALIAGVALIVAVLSLLPMLRLLIELVAPQGKPSVSVLIETLASRSTWVATWHSLQIGIGGTLLALAFGISAALLVGLSDMRGRNAFVLLYVAPLMIAPQVTALAWLQLFGPSSQFLKLLGMAPPLGSRNPLYSVWGIILLLGVQYGPLVFLIVRAGLRKLPRELVEAGLSSGASKWTVLHTIILPLMTPSIIGAAALAFVSCVGNFGIPAFLGIPSNYLVLPTLIYQRLATGGPSVLSSVAVLSVLIGLIAMAGIATQDFIARRRDFRIVSTSLPAAPFKLGRWRVVAEFIAWLLIVVVLVLPIIGLTLSALVPAYGVPLNFATATFENFRFVLLEHGGAARAFSNSIILSLAAALFAVLLAVPLAYMLAWRKKRWTPILNYAAEMPYALPGVVLAIACLLIFLKPLPIIGVSLYNTIWIILFAYLARFFVLALRPTIAGLHQVDRAMEEAARIAGAGLFYRLRTIIFPLVAPATLAGGVLIFMTAFCELTVSALLWASGSETLGVVMFSFEQAGDSAYAAAISVLVVAVTFILMLATNLFARRLPNGVLPWRD